MRSDDKPSLCTAHTNDNNNHDNGKEDATVNDIKKHDDENNNEISFLQYDESHNCHHPYMSLYPTTTLNSTTDFPSTYKYVVVFDRH